MNGEKTIMPLKKRKIEKNERAYSFASTITLAVIGEFKTKTGKFNIFVDSMLVSFAIISLFKPVYEQIINLFKNLFKNSKESAFSNPEFYIILLVFICFSVLCLFLIYTLEKETAFAKDSTKDSKKSSSMSNENEFKETITK